MSEVSPYLMQNVSIEEMFYFEDNLPSSHRSTILLSLVQFRALISLLESETTGELIIYSQDYGLVVNEPRSLFLSVIHITPTFEFSKIQIDVQPLLSYRETLNGFVGKLIFMDFSNNELTLIAMNIPNVKIPLGKCEQYNKSADQLMGDLNSWYDYYRFEVHSTYDRDEKILEVDGSRNPDPNSFSEGDKLLIAERRISYLGQMLAALENHHESERRESNFNIYL